MSAPLPVFEAIRRSLRDIAGRGGAAVEIARPWYFVSCAAMLAGLALGGPIGPDTEILNGGQVLAVIADLVVRTLTGAFIATGWHRHVLLGEPLPVSRYRPPPGSWLYLARSLQIALCAALAAFFSLVAVGLVIELPEGDGAFWILGLISLIGMIVTARLTLILPAAAIGRRSDLGDAIVLAAGNTWRIAVCLLAVAIAVFAALFMVAAVAFAVGGYAGDIFSALVGNAVGCAGTIWSASLLNQIYVWCDGRGPKDEILNL